MTANKDHRDFPRRAAFLVAEYRTDEGTFRDVIKDISANGLFVKTWRKFVAEEPVLIRFPLFRPDQMIQVSGKIVRNDYDGFAVSFDEPILGLTCKDGYLPEIERDGSLSKQRP